MKKEEKQLLLEDLTTRLPYGVKVTTTNPAAEFGVMSGISIKGKISVSTKDADIVFECTEVKPYLRPMSSMTEEEKKEYESLCILIPVNYDSDLSKYDYYTTDSIDSFNWLNAHHFDYRGLIPKGLAIAVTDDNNPYKS